MESDSDSDGSHISATPPRHHHSLSPPPVLLSRSNSKVRIKSTSQSTPNSKLKRKSPLKSTQHPKILQNPYQQGNLQEPYCNNSAVHHSFTSPSSRSNDRNDAVSTAILPAGSRFISKVGSFSSIRKSALNFDSSESDPVLKSGSFLKPKIEGSETRGSPHGLSVDNLDSLQINEGSGVSSKRSVKKPSNLIGVCASLLPAKRPKSGNEGNFVKLNINGHGQKFANKFKKRNSNVSRSFRRGKRRLRARGEGEKKGNLDENEMGAESNAVQERVDVKSSEFDNNLIAVAVEDVRNEASDENLKRLLKLTHGYDSFRDGQLEAIKMVVAGKSTMLVLPTGAGKSLCYQLPAIIFPGITLVVSPLVALMIDQLKQLPPVVHGALLSSSQSSEEVRETLRLLQDGSIKVLFISPERFLNAEFMSIISSSSLISLFVIDEAHCISEWSHNFRPSYMRVRASLLCGELNAQCILAMTATATRKTLQAVMNALDIPATNLVQTSLLRENLQLHVSLSGNRMKDLITLINSHPFTEVQCIIVYCKFQYETDLISKYLRDNNIRAMSYHSGLLAKDRSRIQALFCSNKIRVVVATVAFGMGLDKSDVGVVIHYSLPESLEEYVQEIGRAGRDGRQSYCHLFLDDSIYFKLRTLMYSDGVDEYAVNKLLCQVFSNEMAQRGKFCSIVKEAASRKFDIKEEVILTILTQLELGEVQFLHLLPQINVTCSLNFHKTPPLELAAKDFVVAAILKKSQNKHGIHVFDITAVANSIPLTPMDLLNQLQHLKSMGEITYELKDPAYCYTIVNFPGDFCSLAAQITKWLLEVERCKVWKLDTMFNAAVFAVKSCERIHGCHGAQHTTCLQRKISEYFNEENDCGALNEMKQNSPFLRADIKVFLQSNSQAKFTPRAVARIMHGIGSPAYPSATWSKSHFWGRYSEVDFKVVMEASKAELMTLIGKPAP